MNQHDPKLLADSISRGLQSIRESLKLKQSAALYQRTEQTLDVEIMAIDQLLSEIEQHTEIPPHKRVALGA